MSAAPPPGRPAGYPEHRVVDVGLRDGSTVRLRPVQPGDAAAVLALFSRLSPASRALRFHGAHRLTPDEAVYFCTVDYHDQFGLVAEHTVAGDRRIVALASYFVLPDGRAECAFAVDDALQGRGLGSLLVAQLAEAAAEAGIEVFVAEVLGGNTAMLEVFSATALPLRRSVSAGEVLVEFPTSYTPEAIAAFERREAVSSAAAVASVLRPGSVAVIGASRRRGTVGGEILHNLLAGGFPGPVYAVNPHAVQIEGLPAYPSIGAVPGPVGLAVIVVPAAAVPGVVRECAGAGVHAAAIISAGFAESGAAGRALEREVLQVARDSGIRLVGPNCLGVMNRHPDVRLNATFGPGLPAFGRVGFSSQSGALGIALLEAMARAGLGLSSFASIGNKADLSGNDFLQYWEADPDTGVILMYLESVADPRAFARIARRVSQSKPILAIKGGRSPAGARAAASHTASLASGTVAVDTLFRQAGVVRCDTLEELFGAATVLARHPLPAGPRVAILTNAGGLGILCADACEASGLVVGELSEPTSAALRQFLPPAASLGNPVDMLATATARHYAQACRLLAADPGVDSVIACFAPTLVTPAAEVAPVLGAAATAATKPVIACLAGVGSVADLLGADAAAFAFPESAARALGRSHEYAAWRRRPRGTRPAFGDIAAQDAAGVVAGALARWGPEWLPPGDVAAVLGAYGIPLARGVRVATPAEVAVAAAGMPGPVAVKIDARALVHKSDVGGVALGLATPEAAAAAAASMLERLRRQGLAVEGAGFLVQEMVTGPGAELFAGVTSDPLFGPLLACGAGGVLVELLKDVSVRITPLTDLDAAAMLRDLRIFPLLEGYRGSPRLDVAACEELLLRLSVLVEDLAPVAEIDCNPVFVRPDGDGVLVLDARIRLAPARPVRPRGARRS